MRSTPARVIIDTSVAASIGALGARARRRRRTRPRSSRARSPSSGLAGLQRFSGASMPGRMRVGRTLAYWSKPWQIFRRRPHSVTWSGMCGSPAEPNRMASLPSSAVQPVGRHHLAGARYQSPPQPKFWNAKVKRPSAAASASSTCWLAGTTSRCRCRRREWWRCGRSSCGPRCRQWNVAATVGRPR